MISRVAVIGDPHGCDSEFKELLDKLSWLTLDEIWTVGDLVDRGPDSGAVLRECRERGIRSVMGNHDQSIVNHWDRLQKSGEFPNNPDKCATLKQICAADVEYMRDLPPVHVIDDLNLVIVHGGLFPDLPLYAQPHNVVRAQMIHPDHPGKSHWWGPDAPTKGGLTEDQLREKGWERWYRRYDHEQDCVYGHSTWAQPMIHQNAGCGKTIGVDTGSCFGGSVTAAVFDAKSRDPVFLSVKATKLWYPGARRAFWEAG